jgi:cyclohexadienyl dehydratase
MTHRSVFLALAIGLVALPAVAQNPSPDRLQTILAAGVLRVGTTMDTPVFSMLDPASGALQGFDMDRRSASSSNM